MELPRKTADHVEGESMTAFTMRRVESEVWNKAMDIAQEEIERLNAQVAMLREYFREYQSDETAEPKYYEQVFADTESNWLVMHDKQVRDAALEEAAVKFESDKGYGDWSREFIARDLREMKVES